MRWWAGSCATSRSHRHPSRKMFGYKRAAAAVLSLEQTAGQIACREIGTLPERTPASVPASTRVIPRRSRPRHVQTVEQAVAGTAKARHITDGGSCAPQNFLSRAEDLNNRGDLSVRGAPASTDYRGDLQMYSQWSDGAPRHDEIVEACAARGTPFAAVTDHSYGSERSPAGSPWRMRPDRRASDR